MVGMIVGAGDLVTFAPVAGLFSACMGLLALLLRNVYRTQKSLDKRLDAAEQSNKDSALRWSLLVNWLWQEHHIDVPQEIRDARAPR